MKKFEKDGKVNFVDDNNVFIGFEIDQSCCENAGWFISDLEETIIYDKDFRAIPRKDMDTTGFNFDTTYFKEVTEENQFDRGGLVRFKLTRGEKSLYLHLYNCHNGYYGHGFEAEIGGIKWRKGII